MMGRGADGVPADVHLSFVRSLFGNRGTLFTGMVVHILSHGIVFEKTGANFYLYLSAVLVAIFSYRLYWFRRFDGIDKTLLSKNDIAHWEMRYVYGAALTAAMLGIGSGYSILALDDSFASFICIAVTMASMVSIVGRNYGSRTAVNLQTLGCTLPIIIACLMTRDFYMAVMSIMLVPFGLTTRAMANGVREFLYENVIRRRETAVIAERFDTALNNMPHGLMMLDRDNRIQVINRKACELLQLGDKDSLKDSDLEVVLRFGGRQSFMDGSMPGLIQRQLKQLIDGTLSRALIQFGGDLYLEFSASRRVDGGVVLIFEDVSGRVGAEQKILHMVRFDSLTGLPNRDYFASVLQEHLDTRGRESTVGFMVLDIDEFKHVNDMRGHVTGDKLLCTIAARLRSVAGTRAICGRLMGDHFVLFFANDDGRTDLDLEMRQMHAQLQDVYTVDDLTFHVTMSGGYVVLDSRQLRMEEWQIKADLALFEAKSRGKGMIAGFEQEMDARYIESQKLKSALRDAVENSDLNVVYQPMYRPDGSRIECCEALARWVHPEKGQIPPNVFIQMAEDMGVVSDITRFVLGQACRDCATWPDEIAVSVNLSVQDLRDVNIITVVNGALAAAGLSPSRLHLEVTESCLMDEPVTVRAILSELRGRGITIAIDDFGTGFSSLSYLDTLPLDIVKIDRAFVRNIGEDARRLKLLRGTVHLSRELGLKIVVEGVETLDQLALINKYHCADLVQGYVFSMPVSNQAVITLAEGLAKRLAAGKRKVVVH